jgi:hypothetical protein
MGIPADACHLDVGHCRRLVGRWHLSRQHSDEGEIIAFMTIKLCRLLVLHRWERPVGRVACSVPWAFASPWRRFNFPFERENDNLLQTAAAGALRNNELVCSGVREESGTGLPGV